MSENQTNDLFPNLSIQPADVHMPGIEEARKRAAEAADRAKKLRDERAEISRKAREARAEATKAARDLRKAEKGEKTPKAKDDTERMNAHKTAAREAADAAYQYEMEARQMLKSAVHQLAKKVEADDMSMVSIKAAAARVQSMMTTVDQTAEASGNAQVYAADAEAATTPNEANKWRNLAFGARDTAKGAMLRTQRRMAQTQKGEFDNPFEQPKVEPVIEEQVEPVVEEQPEPAPVKKERKSRK